MSAGQAADVVVRLDRRGDALGAARLDHVGVERSLHEPADVAEPPRLLLEDADELAADDLALLLRLLDSVEQLEEPVLSLHVDERDVEVLAERLDHLLGLVLAQQSVVDEDARELLADRLVHEQRRHGRVDAARQRAQDALMPDLCADPRHLLLDHRGRRPAGRRLGRAVEEVLQHVHAVRGVDDLGMELDAVEAALRSLEGGDRRRRRARDDGRALGSRDDRVAMRHPDGLLGRRVGQQPRLGRLHRGAPELGDARAVDTAAELERHELRAVTDAERRHAELEQRRIDAGRVVGVDGRRAAAEHERVRVPGAHRLGRDRVADELGVDAALAHAPRDQLRVLAAEVENEDRPVLPGRELNDLCLLSADSSAPPS